MGNIIQLVPAGDGPRVDSREIAAHLGVRHKNSVELIERYAEKFRRFGLLPFETEKVAKGRPRRFVLLNEDQCYFLLSLSRNTAKVVDLKADLVAAFGEARRNGHARRLSIMEQLAVLDAKDATSQVKGQLGSRLMNARKFDLRIIRPHRAALERELQPQLALNA